MASIIRIIVPKIAKSKNQLTKYQFVFEVLSKKEKPHCVAFLFCSN